MDNKIGNNTSSRTRSKAAWVTTTAIVLAIAANLGVYELVGIEQEMIQGVITSILSLLGVWGVWNDPTNPEGF